jgi:ATP-dependent helicase/nuclease subunit A
MPTDQIPFDVQGIFELSDRQAAAARERQRDVLVTAGAGSGKTRTLVARYVSLLAEGLPPEQIVAITFTEKAAREMRSRIRQAILEQRDRAASVEARRIWEGLESRMDSARIGTIHSLCTEILRAHPAEARIDPEFGVIEEGLGAALRVEVIETTLARALEDTHLAPLFYLFSVAGLHRLGDFALNRRLDLAGWLAGPPHDSLLQAVEQAALDFLGTEPVAGLLEHLRTMQSTAELLPDAGELLTQQILGLLGIWEQAVFSLQVGEILSGLAALAAGRENYMALNIGKRSSLAKETLRELRENYDALVKPWLLEAPDPSLEKTYAQAMPLLHELFNAFIAAYIHRLREQRALDFDDLEAGALYLLENDLTIRQRWQAALAALLVDEFQDTNDRQRRLIDALGGELPGRCFYVGDDRQSIYRFRGADVTVFRAVRRLVAASGGQVIELRKTYRAHAALLRVAGQLLEPAMASDRQPAPDYWVPFAPLEAEHREHKLAAPFIEFILGEDRRCAAAGLADYLISLYDAHELKDWGQAALLLRASTHFGEYENAFQAAGIPFVTISGRGFYNRPEIRDVLNQLRALANPWDDAALAGLLRSPGFGLSDAALYDLRWAEGPEKPLSMLAALHQYGDSLPHPDQERAARAAALLDELLPQVDSLPVASLLVRLIEATDLRAVLAFGGSRYWQNLDKLLADAHTSRLIQVRAFLEYVDTLRDVGAREGEAPVETTGAVQLMTIHKAKGLEFDLVVLADAAYQPANRREAAYFETQLGLAAIPDRFDRSPVGYDFLRARESHQGLAEEARLLYVALTRARQKLLVCGHLSRGSPRGWLKTLLAATGVDVRTISVADSPLQTDLPQGGSLAVHLSDNPEPASRLVPSDSTLKLERQLPAGAPLFQSNFLEFAAEIPSGDLLESDHDSLADINAQTSGRLLGRLVHRALQRWLFPGNPNLLPLLRTAALESGLVEPAPRQAVLQVAVNLLERFASHALHSEIEAAQVRYHELPYVRPGSALASGAMDLLYLTTSGWKLVDFKTDPLADDSELEQAALNYRPQLARYAGVLAEQLGSPVSCSLVFLDYAGAIRQVPLEQIPLVDS